jgi:hypothetical protein
MTIANEEFPSSEPLKTSSENLQSVKKRLNPHTSQATLRRPSG